jgi:3-methylfumaryl-CoA hydratase
VPCHAFAHNQCPLRHFRRHRPDARLSRFAFGAIKPLFDVAPFFVCGRRNDDGKTIDLWAKDADGYLAMEATATQA